MRRDDFRGPLVGLSAAIVLSTGLIARASDGPPPADEPPPLSPSFIEPASAPSKGPKSDEAVSPASLLPYPSAFATTPTPGELPTVFSFTEAYRASASVTPAEAARMTARSYFEMAKAQFEQGNIERAYNYYSQAVACDPGNIPSQAGIARLLCGSGRTPEALGYLDSLIASHPELAGEAHAIRAFVRAYYAGTGDKAALEAARSDLDRAAKPGPMPPIGRLARARLARLESRPDDAVPDLDWLIQWQVEPAEALIERAIIRRNKGDLPGALADLERAEASHPGRERPKLLWTRGACLADRGDFDRAIADFSEAMKGYHTSGGPLLERAACYQAKGDMDHALVDYDKFVQLHPESPEAYLMRVHALLRKREKGRAMADLDRLVQLMPRSWGVYFYRGVVAWVVSDDRAKAKADFDRALKLDPRLSFVYALRGYLEARESGFVPACLDLGRFVLAYDSTEYYVYGGVDWEQRHWTIGVGWHHKGPDHKDASKKVADLDAQCLDLAFQQLLGAVLGSS